MSDNHYDVIIIGGRCAGASLAIRLANRDLNVLLLDRATFPSLPNVPSSPFIHPGTMDLLDELGIAESEYAHPGSKIENVVVHFGGTSQATMPTSQLGLKRSYFRGIDRSHFDTALWEFAAKATGISARQGLSVVGILNNNEGIINGVSVRSQDGSTETFTGDLIVGADGRFSFAAQQFGSQTLEERNEYTSCGYYADWTGLTPDSSDVAHSMATYNTGQGLLLLVFPLDEDRHAVATIMKPDDERLAQRDRSQVDIEAVYMDILQSIPNLRERLKQAQRVSDVIGMRPIKNGYRQSYGENWALVGDAAHYKDPSDGQGIYDSLIGSKLLANAILDWKQKSKTWSACGAQYQQNLLEATHAMFEQTTANVKQTLYVNIPGFIFQRVGRWMMNDKDFQIQYLRYLSRAIDPKDFRPNPSPVVFIKGFLTDLRSAFS